jgi:mycothiol synthase
MRSNVMTIVPLPDGYRVRAPSRDDAPAVAAVVAVCLRDEGDEGDATEMTADEQLSDWEGLDLAEEAVVLLAPDGQIVANADLVNRRYVRVSVYGHVHPAHRGRGLGTYLAHWGEAWTVRHMPDAPKGTQVDVQHYIRSTNSSALGLLAALDYVTVREVYVMAIELDQAPPPPEWPAGIGVRAFVPSQDERATFDAVEEAFRDIWGRPPGEFDRFLAHTVSERRDPELWLLAIDQPSGTIAGFCLCRVAGNGGWVNSVGVRRPWRERGIGLALLRAVFGVYYARGVRAIELSVDAESATGAPRLYGRAGMRVAKRFAIYRKVLRPGAELTIADDRA